MIEIKKATRERAIVVIAGKDRKPEELSGNDPFAEIKLLADTAGADVVGELSQTSREINPTYYIGSGKAEELKELVGTLTPDVVIFDNDLSPAQGANLEKLLDLKVIDRSGLILDIFALHARTREAKVQVELAQMKYVLTRLTRQWTHIYSQQGGIGFRGPGETQLEIDRRRVRKRIETLSDLLDKIGKQKETGRKQRGNVFKVALVGYTNAGKSTLMNAISGADVPVEDKLFKTLDSTTRRLFTQSAAGMVISDTVGFIKDLPHDLIASFKSTLDEVRDADLLLHVVDISNPLWEEQTEVVKGVLSELGVSNTGVIMVFNKTDRIDSVNSLEGLKVRFPGSILVSGENKVGIEELKQLIVSEMEKNDVTMTTSIPGEKSSLVGDIYRLGIVHKAVETGGMMEITFSMKRAAAEKLGIL